MSVNKLLGVVLFSGFVIFATAGNLTAQKKEDKDAAERIRKAADVLKELAGTPDKKVPNELLERAEAIAVIPNMIKGAFGIGGRWGKGVVSQRLENGRWSPPAFIEVGGGSFGAQIGVTSTDLVLVFTDKKALDLLEEGKDLKLGVDAGVAELRDQGVAFREEVFVVEVFADGRFAALGKKEKQPA